MISGPVVSVVAIFLNAERFLREALDSVLAQSYADWELVLVDDGSSDGSAAIALDYCRKHVERIRYLRHPEGTNRGMSASRNLGIQASRGTYVALLDADDVWLPRKLEQQVALLDAHPTAALVFGAAEYWCGWTGRPDDLARDNVPALGFDANCLHHPPSLAVRLHPLGLGTAPCPSDLLLRRSVVQRLGGFEESFSGPNQLYEDQAFLAKVYLHEPVYASSETWIRYRIHGDSCSSAAARTGTQAAVRQFFLNWLANYLQVHAIEDPEVQSALRQARGGVDPRSASRPAWSLRVAGGSVARLAQHAGPSPRLRVDIDTTCGTSHDVQVNWPNLRLEAGQQYSVRLEARSEAPRSALVGI
jgi:glycosyltransferase involved in cell wall biosynthesis